MLSSFSPVVYGWHRPDYEDSNTQAHTFSNSEDVRQWLVLRALANFPAGEYQANPHAIARAFTRVTLGIRNQSILLDYTPSGDVWMDVPPIHDPLHLQALVYWCAQFNCNLETLSEAYATLGRLPLIKDVYTMVVKLKGRGGEVGGWLKTLGLPTATLRTVQLS